MKAAESTVLLPMGGNAGPLARRVYYQPWRSGGIQGERVVDEQQIQDERLYLLGLSHVDFLRPKEKLLLVEMLGGARPVFGLGLREFHQLFGRRFITRRWDPAAILREAERTERLLTRGEVVCIFYWDPAFPPLLREIHDPPLAVFARGPIPGKGQVLVGVVGTRYPTGGAERASFRLGFELAQQGVGVVSGLARGVDREAHEGCLEAGGISVGVLGSGIDRVYPASSGPTARRLLQAGGALLSEYPPGVPPLAHHFPARNRIINGLSRAVVVVQAPERSGALITADYALTEGRDLVVHQAGLAGSAGAGTRKLCQEGAPVIASAVDLLKEWGWEQRPAAAAGGDQTKPVGMPAGKRLARMLEAETEGVLVQRGGDTYWRR